MVGSRSQRDVEVSSAHGGRPNELRRTHPELGTLTFPRAPLGDIVLQTVVHGVFGAFLCIFGHAYAVKTIGPTRQAAVGAWVPAFAMVAAIPTLGEIPSALNIAGAVVVTAGILLTVFLHGKAAARA